MVNFKKVGIVTIALVGILNTNISTVTDGMENVSCETKTRNNLHENEAELFYMYSNEDGHYFLESNAEHENIIFVGVNDYLIDNNFKIDMSELRHGEKFIGTFSDSALWELLDIKQVNK